MSMDKKAATPQDAQANQFAGEATDEITEIMNEIQSLQQSMAQAQAPRAPVAAVAPAPVPTPAPEADSGLLEEFHASPGEPSMEETLGSMKDETPSASLLEEALATDEVAQVKDGTDRLQSHSDEVESLIEAEMAAEAGRAVAEASFDESTEAALDALDDVHQQEEEEFAPPVRSSRRPPASTPPPRAAAPAPEHDVEESAPAAATDGTMTMVLTGNMTLKLKYEFGGQEVSVKFGDQFLQLTLADGTEFKIPVGRRALKAA
jgi:hypothetical protein